MLTKTLRQLERMGLISRQIFPVIPPRVEYRRTDLGTLLGPVICGLWNWVESNAAPMEHARLDFDRNEVQRRSGI